MLCAELCRHTPGLALHVLQGPWPDSATSQGPVAGGNSSTSAHGHTCIPLGQSAACCSGHHHTGAGREDSELLHPCREHNLYGMKMCQQLYVHGCDVATLPGAALFLRSYARRRHRAASGHVGGHRWRQEATDTEPQAVAPCHTTITRGMRW